MVGSVHGDLVAMLSSLIHDIAFALRQLRKNPGRTLIAISVLALGLGANAAIFSVVNALLLQPLPYKDPGRLVQLFERDVIGTGEEPYNPVAPANYLDWRRDARQFEQIAAAVGLADALVRYGSADVDDAIPERSNGRVALATPVVDPWPLEAPTSRAERAFGVSLALGASAHVT